MDVHRQADRARTIRDRTRDALADPPRCVRGELEAAAPVEELDGTHQADVALLDQVQQGQTLTLVLAGHRHDQPEVGHDEPLAGGLGLAHLGTGLRDGLFGTQTAGAEALFALLAAFDGHGELDLFLLGEQWLASRCLQVEAKVICVVGP